jgi:hypothetical protein
MTAAIAGMTAFGWITEQVGERTSVMGIGLVLVSTAGLVHISGRWMAPVKKDETECL